jgi:uncharacterized Zn finger protein
MSCSISESIAHFLGQLDCRLALFRQFIKKTIQQFNESEKVHALVQGRKSTPYKVDIDIQKISKTNWNIVA